MTFTGMDGDIAEDLRRMRSASGVRLPAAPPMGTICAVFLSLGLLAAFVFLLLFPPPNLSPVGQALILAALLLGGAGAVGLYTATVVEKSYRLKAQEEAHALRTQPGITMKHLRLAIREHIYRGGENTTAEEAENMAQAILTEIYTHRREVIALLNQQGNHTWD